MISDHNTGSRLDPLLELAQLAVGLDVDSRLLRHGGYWSPASRQQLLYNKSTFYPSSYCQVMFHNKSYFCLI
mgnify:CR=1 FL=1